MTHLCAAIVEFAENVSRETLRLRDNGLTVTHKSDNSIVTNADFAADRMIGQFLSALTPDIPIISEESPNLFPRQIHPKYWCVDPIDSTTDYARGGDYFSINIGLIENGRPVLGVLAFPAFDEIYFGSKDMGAHKKNEAGTNPIHCRDTGTELNIVVSSQSHGKIERVQPFIGNKTISSVKRYNGSIKFAMIADGRADFYPRFTNLSEWDIAAGDAIITAAGGSVKSIDGEPMLYGNSENYECPHFVARGAPIPSL